MVYNNMKLLSKNYIKCYLFELQNFRTYPPPANQQCFIQYHENISISVHAHF
jgi:hypothetical protein